ncbi:MAG: DUF2490 domain-containing protein [Cyclobacteriaceae bacterium]|nr:DUF2490 domain-containing protein [Cyclobacteriaceae bacterium]
MKLFNTYSKLSTPFIFCIVITMFYAQSLSAQQNNVGNWLMYLGQNRISDELSVHSEIQYRNHTVASADIEQLLLRTGINYHISSSTLSTAGYARIFSYQYGSPEKKAEKEEHRIWQQLITTHKEGRVKFEHRYRIEQRWVNSNYSNRLRYRLMLFVPINKPKIEKGTLFLGAYDEVFVNTQKVFFDRNRLYGALGYQLNKSTSLQIGGLHQQVNDFGKWHLQFLIVYNPDFRKSSNDVK